MKSEYTFVGWAIVTEADIGLRIWPTRKEAIASVMTDGFHDWEYYYRRWNRAVRVTLSWEDNL